MTLNLTNQNIKDLNAGIILESNSFGGLMLQDGVIKYVENPRSKSPRTSAIVDYGRTSDYTFKAVEPEKTITLKQSELDELKAKIKELESRAK